MTLQELVRRATAYEQEWDLPELSVVDFVVQLHEEGHIADVGYKPDIEHGGEG